jgi:hypothetical protein
MAAFSVFTPATQRDENETKVPPLVVGDNENREVSPSVGRRIFGVYAVNTAAGAKLAGRGRGPVPT